MDAGAAQSVPRDDLMIADFEEPGVLTRVGWNAGVSVSLTEADAVSGTRAWMRSRPSTTCLLLATIRPCRSRSSTVSC